MPEKICDIWPTGDVLSGDGGPLVDGIGCLASTGACADLLRNGEDVAGEGAIPDALAGAFGTGAKTEGRPIVGIVSEERDGLGKGNASRRNAGSVATAGALSCFLVNVVTGGGRVPSWR